MPTNFVLGCALMWLGQYEARQNPDQVFTKPLVYSWMYSLFIFCPVALWSFYKYPAWATAYLRPESAIPGWTGLAMVLIYFFGMVLGTTVSQLLLQNRKPLMFWFVFLFGILWLMLVAFMTRDEYRSIGTYIDYHAGQATFVLDDKTFLLEMNIMGLVIALPLFLLGFYLYKRGQRIRYIFRV
jgi:hypothetical protein